MYRQRTTAKECSIQRHYFANNFFAIEQCALQLMILSRIYEIISTNILLSMNKTDSLDRDIIHKYNDLTERVTEI